jgi:hypothetical protein
MGCSAIKWHLMLIAYWYNTGAHSKPDRTVVTGDQLIIKIENLKLIVKNYDR